MIANRKSNAAMAELLELRRIQQDQVRQALDAETEQSQQNFRDRVQAARHDPSLNLDIEDENKD